MSDILIITISGVTYGIGHLVRSHNLAASIKVKQHKVMIIDVSKENEITQYSDITKQLKLFTAKIKALGFGKIVIDLPSVVDLTQMEVLSGEFDVYGIDDISQKRFHYKKVFYPYSGNPHRLSWGKRRSTKICGGSEFSILNPYLDQLKLKNDNDARGTLVSFGGSDPHNLSSYFLNSKIPSGHRFTLNLGPLVSTPGQNIATSIDVVRPKTPKEFLDILSSHQVIICGFGVTVYEALSLSRPVIAICSTTDHTRSAKKISENTKHFYFMEKQSYLENPDTIFDLILEISGKKSSWFESSDVNQAIVQEICE